MHGNIALNRPFRAVTVGLMLWLPGFSLLGAEVNLVRTNWFDHWVTNVIEVRMPVNRFVNECHTNSVTQVRTNAIEVEVTNQVVVDAFWTNVVVAYETNWNMRTLTNRLAVNLLRTNYVDQLQTNWSTLNLTNWETVVLFKTNWVNQPVTNVVQLDLPGRPAPVVAASEPAAEPSEARADAVAPLMAAVWTGPVAIEAARTARTAVNNLVEVRLKVHRTGNATGRLQVQQWRVEREDGAILLFGQEQEFLRQLPAGKYRVEARLTGEGKDLPPSVKGTLSVTANEATVQQRLFVKR